MSTKTMIGLEAEMFLKNKDGDIVIIPRSLPRDGFPLLLEVRGKPAITAMEAFTNFMSKYYIIKEMVDPYKIIMANEMDVTGDLYNAALAEMSPEEIGESKGAVQSTRGVVDAYSNIITDANGKVIAYKVTAGLHIHFSAVDTFKYGNEYKSKYEPITLPLTIQTDGCKNLHPYITLYKKEYEDSNSTPKVRTINMLNVPTIEHIVTECDKQLYKKYGPEIISKTRQPGFWESKDDGRFEYRSLPFNKLVFDDLLNISKKAKDILSSCYD